MTTVGTGKYTYTLIEDWAKLPQGESFGMVSAVATDSQDRVYAFSVRTASANVRPGRQPPELLGHRCDHRPSRHLHSRRHSLHHRREDSVALKFTLEGKPLLVLGQRGVHSDTGCETAGDVAPRSAGPFNYPTELVPAPSGDLYVSDGYRNARVHRFSSDGRLISSWGEPGQRRTQPVPSAPQPPGAHRRPHLPLRPGEQPHPDILPRRPVHHHVDRHASSTGHHRGPGRYLLHQ